MTPQPMHAGDAGVTPNTTARHEIAADETLGRITRARTDADTPDDAAAEQAWRRIATLASRLHREARAVVIAHEGHAAAQRELVAESLLHCPDGAERRARRAGR
jgi:hypothetical protein